MATAKQRRQQQRRRRPTSGAASGAAASPAAPRAAPSGERPTGAGDRATDGTVDPERVSSPPRTVDAAGDDADFGLTTAKPGVANWIIAVVVIGVLVAVAVALLSA